MRRTLLLLLAILALAVAILPAAAGPLPEPPPPCPTPLPPPPQPGPAFSRRSEPGWTTFLPADRAWIDLLKSAPADILSDAERAAWLEMYGDQQIDLLAAPLGGALPPWAGGETRYLSQSVAHDRYTAGRSAHYAFDFYNGTMFKLYAAKAGLVALARWDVPNGDDKDMGNYLLLQDPTTNPVTYMLYLHLATDSIPPDLRQIGATVVQGQFIGLAGDTR